MRIGFYEKDFSALNRGITDNQYVPFISVEHMSSKEGQKTTKKVLAEVLLRPQDFNFGEVDTFDCR